MNLVKNENGDLLEDSDNILNRWKNYFSRLLNAHRFIDIRYTEIHTPEPLLLQLVLLSLKLLSKNLRSINRHVLIKFRQNSFKKVTF
jgi:hypothetical protein